MKKIIFLFLLLSFCTILTGCNSIREQQAENAIEKYYQALIDENYEAAFNELYLYDEEIHDDQTKLTKEEAQTVYLEKTKTLQEQGYQMKGYEITELEYEDGHSFWHHLNIEVMHGTETISYKETAYFQDGKLKISGEDPYIQLRDGRMN